MDRQTLRDWVIRYNADGIDGLYDQPKGHHPEKPSETEQAVLLAKVFQAPDPSRDGTFAWTLADLCDLAEARFGKRLSTSGMWGIANKIHTSAEKYEIKINYRLIFLARLAICVDTLCERRKSHHE